MKNIRPCLVAATLAVGLAACRPNPPPAGNWSAYGGDPHQRHYSALTQIDTANVNRLTVAWTYRAGDADTAGGTQMQCNPLVIDGTLYGISPRLKLFALNAATGQERWRFDPNQGDLPGWTGFSRGLAHVYDGDTLRLLYAAGAFLFKVDAATGALVTAFGNGGTVDLREGLGRDPAEVFYVATSPGVVYRDLYILGGRVSEGADAAPGYLRAYNVRTGKRTWTFHTIPQPGEAGHETWEDPDAWRTVGGANAWAGLALDSARGIVYAPTGSAAYDFYGGNRRGRNLYANCVLALEAATGKYVWHFQTVHHDLWDRDLPAAPNLVTVQHNGRPVDAVAQITKTGFVFLLDRETGVPLFPVEEVPVPASHLAGEAAWPTQPVPARPRPFTRQAFTEEMITDRTPQAAAVVRQQWAALRNEGPFAPPSERGTLIFPDFDGGGGWGGAAFDPDGGLLYVNANHLGAIITMRPMEVAAPAGNVTLAGLGKALYARNCAACHGPDRAGVGGQYPSLVQVSARLPVGQIDDVIHHGRGMMPGFPQLKQGEREALVAYLTDKEGSADVPAPATLSGPQLPYQSTGYHRFLDPDGYPANRPPWGTLSAIDLNTGATRWQVTLGHHDALPGPPTGTRNYGGPVVTAGGVVFIAATQDGRIRAFSKSSGRTLWQARLPAAGYATPATYQANGRQYVVVAAGGGKLGSPSGDYYVAYALP